MLLAISIFLAACTAAVIGAGFTRNRVPVAASVGIAAALRIAFALMVSQRYTPYDSRVYFRTTAELVLHGREPLQNMPGREWNFLELMPYIHAAELKTGLPWVLAVKIAPIAADVVLVWIVSRLAGADGRTRALQYAVNPVSLLVSSLHGQVEPVALALALGGVLVLRTRRPFLAGVLLGAAVAAKTWPVLILVAVLPGRAPGRAARILAGAAIVPALCLLSGMAFLGTDIPRALKHVLSYSGYVQMWTWTGTWLQFGHPRISGYNSSISGLADALMLVAVAITLFLLRRRPPEVRALGALCAALACTAGFGVQYLMWVLPLAFALAGIWRYGYVITAGTWAALAYVGPQGFTTRRMLSWAIAAMLVGMIAEQVRARPLARHRQAADNHLESGSGPLPVSPLRRGR